MRIRLKQLANLALCVFLGAAAGASAQQPNVTRKRIPQDPAAAALKKLLADAQIAVDSKDFEAAVSDYQEYLAKKPDDATVHFLLGYAYTALQRPADAKSEYEKAISLDPKMPEAYLNLGLTIMEADPGGAVAPLRKAVELLPDQARPKFLLGWALERSGKLDAAIEQYQAAKEIDDQDFEIRFALGRVLLTSDRPKDAETEFREAVTLQSNSATAHLGLAQSLFAQKKLEAAAAEYAEYLSIEPNDLAARVERASALVDLGRDDDALVELDRVAAGGTEDLRALKLRSLVYFHKKRYNDAVPVLQKAATLAPQDPDIPARLGHVYLEKKDYANAVRVLVVAFKMNPQSNDVLGDLIAGQYLNKNYPAALQGLDLLGQREPLPLGSWFIRATCYDKLGQLPQALEAYQKFLELNKDENNDMYFESAARARTIARELKDKKR
ncbi:MAG: tetratricopeptide repeat protein [Candidatus Acidiferrales bacterium]